MDVSRKGRFPSQRGLSLIELIVASAILSILTMMVLPLARVQLRREQEKELRIALREIRMAIDRFKDSSDKGFIQKELDSEGYPKELEMLVEGVDMVNSPDGKKLRFLRRIPRDPMTNTTEWGKRALQDDADSTSWGGSNVFDVYTTSPGVGLDGTPYSEW